MLHLQAKAPGDELVTQPIDLEVSYDQALGRREEAYQRLLEDAMEGDRRRFGRADSLDEQWRIVDRGARRPARDAPLQGGHDGARRRPTRLAADVGGWRDPLAARAGLEPDGRPAPPSRTTRSRTSSRSAASSCARSGSWSASASCSAAWFAGSYGERIGVPREETYRLATRLVSPASSARA